jgi:hypothetical protein
MMKKCVWVRAVVSLVSVAAEIGAIYAEHLKELQNAIRWRSPMFMRFSCMLLKT